MSDFYGGYSSCYWCGPGVPGGHFNRHGEELCFACLCRDEERQTEYEDREPEDNE